MKIDIKSLLFYTLLPIILSFTVMMIINGSISNFSNIKLPINLNRSVFIIVWSILYIISGVAAYIIDKFEGDLKIYYLGLVLNILWIVVFFVGNNNVISLIYTLIFTFVIFVNMTKFYNKNKLAGILMLPYFLWSLFAVYLMIGIIVLN